MFLQVTVFNGLAEFGIDYKMWLFEVVIIAEFRKTYTETSGCLDLLNKNRAMPEAAGETNRVAVCHRLLDQS